MNNANTGKIRTLLFNPFIHIAGWKALLIGLAVILISGLLASMSNTHFDGVLDTHSGGSAPGWFFISEGLINWLSLSVTCLIFGRFAAKGPFRAIDVFGTQALARWPMLLTALATLIPGYSRFIRLLIDYIRTQQMPDPPPPGDLIAFGTVVLIMICSLIWMIRLMYKAYETACGIPPKTAVKTFIGALIAAEVISKIVILSGLKSF